jgi:hypothetical protein
MERLLDRSLHGAYALALAEEYRLEEGERIVLHMG